jgi:hypothetical protein
VPAKTNLVEDVHEPKILLGLLEGFLSFVDLNRHLFNGGAVSTIVKDDEQSGKKG